MTDDTPPCAIPGCPNPALPRVGSRGTAPKYCALRAGSNAAHKRRRTRDRRDRREKAIAEIMATGIPREAAERVFEAGESIGRSLDVERVMRAAGAVEGVMGLGERVAFEPARKATKR